MKTETTTTTTKEQHRQVSFAPMNKNNTDKDDNSQSSNFVTPSYEFHDYFGEASDDDDDDTNNHYNYDDDYNQTGDIVQHQQQQPQQDKDPEQQQSSSSFLNNNNNNNSQRRRMGSHRQAFMPFQISYKPQQRIVRTKKTKKEEKNQPCFSLSLTYPCFVHILPDVLFTACPTTKMGR